MKFRTSLTLACALLALGCHRKTAPPPAVEIAEPDTAASAPVSAQGVPPFSASTFELSGRVVAIGDIHGDWNAMVQALRIAGLIDEAGAWIGGTTTLVQTGDLLDRGDDEQRIFDYLRALRDEAKAAGGQVVLLNGNHEVMNVAGDLRYVTLGGFKDFEDVPGLDLDAPELAVVPQRARARMAAFRPGGPYAKKVADYPIIAIVGDSVFAHGGVLPEHVTYGIDRINAESAAWMRDEQDPPLVLQSEAAPIWTRVFSGDTPDCATLQETLDLLGVERMVVGHTVQQHGITSACDGKVWRVDVGMARHYGGKADALIIDQGVRVASKATDGPEGSPRGQ